jgi:hypothetical protein
MADEIARQGPPRKGRVATSAAARYIPGVAKRMLLHYQKGGFPSYEVVDEQGMPQPCVLGIPWVNGDTQKTLARLRIPRTDPWGRPLPDPEGDIPGSR